MAERNETNFNTFFYEGCLTLFTKAKIGSGYVGVNGGQTLWTKKIFFIWKSLSYENFPSIVQMHINWTIKWCLQVASKLWFLALLFCFWKKVKASIYFTRCVSKRLVRRIINLLNNQYKSLTSSSPSWKPWNQIRKRKSSLKISLDMSSMLWTTPLSHKRGNKTEN